jgi:hypothetical protein
VPPAGHGQHHQLQAARRHAEITNLADDLQKYLVLSELQPATAYGLYSVLGHSLF